MPRRKNRRAAGFLSNTPPFMHGGDQCECSILHAKKQIQVALIMLEPSHASVHPLGSLVTKEVGHYTRKSSFAFGWDEALL